MIDIIAWAALGLSVVFTAASAITHRHGYLWITWSLLALATFLTAVDWFGVRWSLLGTAIAVAVGSAVFYGYRAVREGFRLPNRSDEYSKTISEAQQGAVSSRELRDVYLPDDDVPHGRHAVIDADDVTFDHDFDPRRGTPLDHRGYVDGDDTRPSMRPV